MIATDLNIAFNMDKQAIVSLTLKGRDIEHLKDLKQHVDGGKLLDVTIKKFRKKRSLDANAYLWILLQELAVKLESSKEDIYRTFIKDYGSHETIPLRNDVVEKWCSNWSSKGIGWLTDNLGDSKLEGYTNIVNYYGTSTYDTAEMARLLDQVVEECKANGIETKSPEELERMIGYGLENPKQK